MYFTHTNVNYFRYGFQMLKFIAGLSLFLECERELERERARQILLICKIICIILV